MYIEQSISSNNGTNNLNKSNNTNNHNNNTQNQRQIRSIENQEKWQKFMTACPTRYNSGNYVAEIIHINQFVLFIADHTKQCQNELGHIFIIFF